MPRSDMFFKATGQRSGVITGESTDRRFAGQIDVVDWSWGMSAPSAINGQRTGRLQVKELLLVKRADRASTALMAVMRNNEVLSSAVLSVRKAGGNDPLPFMIITLNRARIVAYDIESDTLPDGAPTLTEKIALHFQDMTVDYEPQGTGGAGGGASSVTIDNNPAV
ncbi:MAG: type VI secretion system tube protein Hcp [Rubrivivax sp.]|nr:type VI secretion system tube protein Hcp [Rubrivivax sp.]MCW5611990.1 type VI secretion system tube protein Hcp [Rubrivivax sp.]